MTEATMEEPQRRDDPPTDEEAQTVGPIKILDQEKNFELRQDAACLLFIAAMFFVPPIITSLGVGLMDDELLKSDDLVSGIVNLRVPPHFQ
ncbi:MAG: hypothetical protein IPI83_15600 [Sphingomonadales bacterium]|nr:hypothetical protein [Sphingomonadales bacterium]